MPSFVLDDWHSNKRTREGIQRFLCVVNSRSQSVRKPGKQRENSWDLFPFISYHFKSMAYDSCDTSKLFLIQCLVDLCHCSLLRMGGKVSNRGEGLKIPDELGESFPAKLIQVEGSRRQCLMLLFARSSRAHLPCPSRKALCFLCWIQGCPTSLLFWEDISVLYP